MSFRPKITWTVLPALSGDGVPIFPARPSDFRTLLVLNSIYTQNCIDANVHTILPLEPNTVTMRFEWDEKKSRLNRKQHGVSFAIAREVFADPFCLTVEDRRSLEKSVSGQSAAWKISRSSWWFTPPATKMERKLRESSQRERRLLGSEDSMKKLTSKQRQKELKAIAAIPDDRINTSDIPELTGEQLSRAIRGQMYRPIKRPVP